MYCDPWLEVLCTGQVIYHGPKAGCFNEDECKPLAKGNTGETCPVESDDNGCPIICPEPEYVKCPAEIGDQGCKTESICAKKTIGDDGEYCPDHSVCPTVCQPNEVRCNQTGTDDNGCRLPELCVLQERNFNGELCEVHCPPKCDPENEILCDGGNLIQKYCMIYIIFHL